MNPNNQKKRRYFLGKSKKKSRQHKMDDEEVATDYKLQQFLADVQKFSHKIKEKKEDKSGSEAVGGKSQTCNTRRGLFESGLLSKACVKGALGLKNKARLIGNLEKIVAEETSVEPLAPITSKACEERSEVIAMCKERVAAVVQADQNKFDTRQWWDDLYKKKVHYQEELWRLDNNTSYTNSEREKKKEEIINRYLKPDQKLTEQQYLQLFSRLRPTCKLKDDLLKECQESLLEKILKEDPVVLNKIASLLKKGSTEERSVQTDLTLDDLNYLTNNDKNEESIPRHDVNIFTPPKKEADFILPIPATGKPHASVIHQNPDKSNSNTFFDAGVVDGERRITEVGFRFASPLSSVLHFLSPPKRRKRSLFEGDVTPRFVPEVFEEEVRRPYFPLIVTPPSPGRKYSDSPHFLQLPQFQHVNKYYTADRNNDGLGGKAENEDMFNAKTSHANNPSFPKRHKVYFSPHRFY